MMRRAHIDLLRGFAVVCMIEWHVIDAWAVVTGRDSAAWDVIRMFGGVAAPAFLFLAGLAVPLAGESRMRRGASLDAAARQLQIRGWQIFLLAHLFRFQSFLLNPNARWHSLLKPDILNILGLGLVVTAILWRQARRGRTAGGWSAITWLLAPALLICAVTPFAPLWSWPTVLHPRLEAYIRPVPGNYGVFTLFPALAFVPLGALAGLLLAQGNDDGRIHRRFAGWGAVLVAVGVLASFTPEWWRVVHFWAAPLAMFVWRVGSMLLMLWAARLLCAWRPPAPSHWLMVFGRTSLIVYWIHVELAYGIISYPLHYALPLGWAVAGFVVVTLLMLAAARRWERRGPLRIPAHMLVLDPKRSA